MARKIQKNKKTTYFGKGDSKKLHQSIEKKEEGCVFTFKYQSPRATDPQPVIIMTGPRWIAKNGGLYISGVNVNDLNPRTRKMLIRKFGSLPVGSVSFNDLKAATKADPTCCIRTYNTENVRALHKVEV